MQLGIVGVYRHCKRIQLVALEENLEAARAAHVSLNLRNVIRNYLS